MTAQPSSHTGAERGFVRGLVLVSALLAGLAVWWFGPAGRGPASPAPGLRGDEGRALDHAARDGAWRDGVGRDGAGRDGAGRDGAALDTVRDDTAPAGAAHDGAVSDGTVSEGGATLDVEERLAALARVIDRPALEALHAELVARLVADPGDGEASLALCETARWLGRPDEARQYGEHATALLPESALAHARLARALAAGMKTGGMLAALRSLGPFKTHLARARELDPHDVATRADEIAFLAFAPGLVGGDKERALVMAKGLDADDPVLAALFEGLVLAADDRLGDAATHIEAALARHPGERRLHVGLGMLLVQAERYAEAEPHLLAARAASHAPLDETHWQAVYGLARMRVLDERDWQQALDDLDAYLAADPYGDLLPLRWGVLQRRAETLTALGRTDEAHAAWLACLAEDPDNEPAADALRVLARDR